MPPYHVTGVTKGPYAFISTSGTCSWAAVLLPFIEQDNLYKQGLGAGNNWTYGNGSPAVHLHKPQGLYLSV